MKVAVTGGSGVVGAVLIRHLVSAGHDVRALTRSQESAETLASLGAVAMFGDVLDERSLLRLAGGAEWVFHVAGVNTVCPREPGSMWNVNVEGTRNVVGACRSAGVSRLIHTSSASTIGQETGAIGSEETQHRGWFLSAYERSKTEAERVAFEESAGLEVVAVNPSSVQGPGRSTGTGRLFLKAARDRLPFAVETTVSLVDIDDCARGHLLAAERGAPGERYLLSGATLTVSEAVALLSEVIGIEVVPRYVAPRRLAEVATVVEWIWRLTRRPAPICREVVRVLAHGHSYDGSKATRELGLEYTPLLKTLSRTLEWFGSEGLLEPQR